MRKKFKIGSIAASALLLGSGLTAASMGPASASDAPAAAQSCYGSAYSYQGYPAGGSLIYAYYPAWGTWDSVDGNCNDINIKTNYTRDVRVCTHNKCHNWVTATKGNWTVIFPNSTPGAEYYLQFKGVNASSGYLAS